MGFRFQKTKISEVILIEPSTARDARGYFREMYKLSEFASHGLPPFVQDNLSHSVQGVLRGLHYQKPPRAQGKFVAAFEGRILDVAVDIRKGSPTFREWVGVELSDDNGLALYIPPGFAHGFCVLSATATINYKVTAEYAPELERGIYWNDTAIGVDWQTHAPILSPRDERLPLLSHAGDDFVYEEPRRRRQGAGLTGAVFDADAR